MLLEKKLEKKGIDSVINKQNKSVINSQDRILILYGYSCNINSLIENYQPSTVASLSCHFAFLLFIMITFNVAVDIDVRIYD